AEDSGSAVEFGTIESDPGSVRRLVNKLGELSLLRVAYEAGPTGYALHRQLTLLGHQVRRGRTLIGSQATGGPGQDRSPERCPACSPAAEWRPYSDLGAK